MKLLLQSAEDAAKVVENLIVPDSVQKAQLAETVNKLINTDYNQLFNDLISQAMWIALKIAVRRGRRNGCDLVS